MLFNEPKLLKYHQFDCYIPELCCFSALQRAEIAEIDDNAQALPGDHPVSVLFNEPKLLKLAQPRRNDAGALVSVLFNEPKLLKCHQLAKQDRHHCVGFSALQRAEIAEIPDDYIQELHVDDVSVLFNEPKLLKSCDPCWTARPSQLFQCSSTSRNC